MSQSNNQPSCQYNPVGLAEKEWLSPDEASSLLGVSRNTIYESIKQNKVPGVLRIGRRITIHKKALVDACSKPAEPDEDER